MCIKIEQAGEKNLTLHWNKNEWKQIISNTYVPNLDLSNQKGRNWAANWDLPKETVLSMVAWKAKYFLSELGSVLDLADLTLRGTTKLRDVVKYSRDVSARNFK